MSMDQTGNIYILDNVMARVSKWAQKAVTGSVVAGDNGDGDNINQMNSPNGMYLEQTTSIVWIADTYNHRIVKWTTPSTSELVCGGYGSESNQLMYPFGLFIDESDSNTLYVADTGNHRIQKWLTNATHGITMAGITSFYGNELFQLWAHQALIVDTNKNMFIMDTGNNRIMRWKIGSSSGEVISSPDTLTMPSSGIYQPYGIKFDSNGALFVIDGGTGYVLEFSVTCRKYHL